MQQKAPKINFRHLTEDQYKKQKNIPPQDPPRKCLPDQDHPFDLVMEPKKEVNMNVQSQRNTSINTTSTVTSRQRTLSYNVTSTQQSVPQQKPIVMIQQVSSQGYIHPVSSAQILTNQRSSLQSSSNAVNSSICQNPLHEMFQSQVTDMNNQLNQEREAAKQLFEALQKCQSDIIELKKFNEEERGNNKNLSETNQHLEEKMVLLTSEIERLRQIASDKNQTISKLEEQISKFTSELEWLKREKKQYEEEWNFKGSIEIERFKRENSQLGEKVVNLSVEIERLQNLGSQRNRDSEDQIKKARLDAEKERERTREVEERVRELQLKIRQYEEVTLREYEMKWRESERQIQMRESREFGLENKIREYEEKIVNLTVEIERLSGGLQIKGREREEFEKIQRQREQQFEERITSFSIEIERLSSQLQARNQQIIDQSKDYERIIIELRGKCDEAEEGVKRSKKQDKEREEREKQQFEREKSNIEKDRLNIEKEVSRLTMRLVEFENEKEFQQKEIQRLSQTIDSLYDERDNQNNEINQMRNDLNYQEQTIRGLRDGMEQLTTELNSKLSSTQREQNEINVKIELERKQFDNVRIQKDQQIQALENNLTILTSETDRLRSLCDKKAREIEELKQTELNQAHKIDSLSSQIIKISNEFRESERSLKQNAENDLKQLERQKNYELEQLEKELKRDMNESSSELSSCIQLKQEQNIQYLMKIVLLSAEVERLIQLNQKIWEDNCVLQAREREIEQDYQQEFTAFKLDLEQSHRVKLEQELNEIYQRIEHNENEYAEQIHKYQSELDQAHQHISSLEITINGLENKIGLITIENQRLLTIKTEQDSNKEQYEKQVKSMRDCIVQLEQSIEALKSDNSTICNVLTQKEDELKDQQNQNADMSQQYENLLGEEQNKYLVISQKFEQQQVSMESLYQQAQNLTGQLEQSKSTIQSLLMKIVLERAILETTFSRLQQLQDQLFKQDQTINQKASESDKILREQKTHIERITYESKIMVEQLEQKYSSKQSDLLIQIVLSSSELERVSKQNEELRAVAEGTNERLEIVANEHERMIKEFESLAENYNELVSNYNELANEKRQLEEQLNEREENIKKSKMQNEDVVHKYETEKLQIIQQIEILQGEKEQFQSERDQLISCVQELEDQCRFMNEDLGLKEQQLQQFSNSLETLTEEKNTYIQQMQTFEVKYQQTIVKFEEERNHFQKEIEGYENVIRMLEMNIEQLTEEKETLTFQAQERVKQLEEWRSKYSGSGGEDREKLIRDIDTQRQKIHELEDKLIKKSEQNNDLQLKINKQIQESQLLEEERQELLVLLESRKQENDQKSKEVTEKRDKINELSEQIRQLEAELLKKHELTHSSIGDLRQSQAISKQQGSEIKAKYHQMFQRVPLETKDSNNSISYSSISNSGIQKNKSFDLAQYSKLTTNIITTTTTTSGQVLNQENKEAKYIGTNTTNSNPQNNNFDLSRINLSYNQQ